MLLLDLVCILIASRFSGGSEFSVSFVFGEMEFEVGQCLSVACFWHHVVYARWCILLESMML